MSTVMIIPDCHAPCMRRGAIPFLEDTRDEYQPDHIVHIGDLVDHCAYSFHEKPPNLKDPRAERRLAKRQVQRLVEAFPEADLLIGNHDALPQRQAEKAGLDPDELKPFNDRWGLPEGWTIHKRFSTLTIDDVDYFHGDKFGGGMYAHLHNCKSQFRSVVQGHLHANFGVMWHANPTNRVFGMSVGCLVDADKQAMEYGIRYPRKPILGCGIVIDGVYPICVPWILPTKGRGSRLVPTNIKG